MTDDKWPFNNKIAQIGFPFEYSSVFGYSSLINELLEILIELHKRHTGSHIRSIIVCWLSDFIHPVEMSYIEKKALDLIPYFQKKKMIIDSGSLFLLMMINWEDKLSKDTIDFFDELGKQKQLIPPYSLMDKLSTHLSETFSMNPDRFGILRVLSYLVIGGSIPSVPNFFLELKRYTDPMFRESAIIVRLGQGKLSEEKGRALAQHSVKLICDSSDFVNNLFRAINEHKGIDHSVDLFLIELKNELPYSEWKTIQKIIQALNDSLRRRKSRFEDPQIWSELGLPQGLNKLFCEQK